MPTTFTNNARLAKQGIGENDNTWGIIANTQYDLIDELVTGVHSINVSTGIDVTLNSENGVSDEARKMVLKLSGTPTAAISVFVPASPKLYVIDGAGIVGTETVTIAPTGGGAGVSFEAGQTGVVYCDGVDVRVIIKTEPAFVTGMVQMWSGTIATIPAGWALCDGTNGTPNLINKFVIGAQEDEAGVAKTSIEGALSQTGGLVLATTSLSGAHSHGGQSEETILDITHIPPHRHLAGGHSEFGTGDFVNVSSRNTGASTGGRRYYTDEQGGGLGHFHVITEEPDHSHEVATVPPYYALAFIMKT